MENLLLLIEELRQLPNETQWVEFKHDKYKPEMIGEDISALANSATVIEKSCSYMLWGIDNTTHEIVGTSYNLQNLKKGNEELENWLRGNLSGNTDFEFDSVETKKGTVGVLKVYKAVTYPVRFRKESYIRIGSYTKKLNDYPAVQAQLWNKLTNSNFEDRYAKENLNLDDTLQQLQCSLYFDMMGVPQPSDNEKIAYVLLQYNIIAKQDDGLYAITNLGAVLFAKRLSDFSSISRKMLRIVQYNGKSKIDLMREVTEKGGYAVEFENALKYVEALLPARELLENGIRIKKTAFPSVAIREIVANALIHQDFSISGAGPVIEVFSNRIEVTNPGAPLVDVFRILDNPPRSRNEKLAGLSRRLGMCEELGSGWDKIITSCEYMQLPAPRISIYEESTKVILLSSEKYSNMSQEDRLWTCYMHACIKEISQEQLTNQSLRKRFGVSTSSSGSISRLIKLAVEKNLIKPLDPDTAPRYMKYIPIWA